MIIIRHFLLVFFVLVIMVIEASAQMIINKRFNVSGEVLTNPGIGFDFRKLNHERFNLVVNDNGITAYSSIVYSKSLERNILLVVELFQLKGKIIYRLLFSTDTTQAPIDVIDIYHTRFQIEFTFRDTKQFVGLENSQARSGNKLNFHFNAALTAVNIAKVMQLSNPQTRENSFSMATYKILFHNTLMLSRFFRLFAINPNSIKNRQPVNELLYFGTMAA